MRRFRFALCLAFCLIPGAPRPLPAQTFSQALNNATSSLAQAHSIPLVPGTGTLVLQPGHGARFGTPSVDAPIRVTVARANALVGGQIVAGTAHTIYLCTARTGDTLSGLTAVENTSDQAFSKNDPVSANFTAGMIAELQSAVATNVASLAGKADDASVVKLATDQTITGAKTHLAPITVNTPADYIGPALHLERRNAAPNAGEFFLRFQTPYSVQGEYSTYINNAGAYYSLAWMVVSGHKQGNGDTFQILVPTARPAMISSWADTPDHVMALRDNSSANSWYLGCINDTSGKYDVGLLKGGKIGLGETAALDANGIPAFQAYLYASAAGALKTDETFTSAAGLRAGKGTATSNILLQANIGAGDVNSERVLRLFNANVNAGNVDFSGLSVQIGTGSTIPDGWLAINGIGHDGTTLTPLIYAHMSGATPGRGEVHLGGDLRLVRGNNLVSNSSLGEVVPWAQFSTSNVLKIGPQFNGGSGYGVDNFVDGTAAKTTWNVFGGARLMALTGTGNLALGATESYGGGAGVMFIANATTAPTSNPTGGGVLYSQGGALHWLSPGGTNTVIAPN